MNTVISHRYLFPCRLAFVLLASAIAIPSFAQSGQSQSATDSQPSPMTTAPTPSLTSAPGKEGFWGRVNPFARKKWVNNRVDPVRNQVNELDEVNAKNGRDIQDVDRRAQAGIRQAQSAADAANQTATLAGSQAQKAHTTALGASTHVDQLNTTVSGLDQYKQAGE